MYREELMIIKNWFIIYLFEMDSIGSKELDVYKSHIEPILSKGDKLMMDRLLSLVKVESSS